jgi:hypothetical protein
MADEPSGTSNAEEPGDVYPVRPPDPDHIERRPPSPSTDINEAVSAAEKEESRFQFSIAEMLLLVGAAALFLGILGCFPREYGAGLAGFGALVSMLVLILLKPTQPIVRLGWWAILFIYTMMVLAKILEAR